MSDRFVSVAVPVAVDRGFTYRVPWDETPQPGSRVLVPFGQRTMIGVVRPSADESPPEKTRDLLELLDAPGHAALTDELVSLCEWIQDYYVAAVGEVYRLALPGLMTNVDARTASLTQLGRRVVEGAQAGPLLSGGVPDPTKHERRVLEAIVAAPGGRLAVAKLTSLRPRVPAVLKLLAELEARQWCATEWSDGGSEARTEQHYRRTDYLRGAGADEDALQAVIGRSKQRRAVLDYLDSQDDWVSIGELRGPFPRVRKLLEPLVASGLVALEERLRELDPFAVGDTESTEPQVPTEDQRVALEAIENCTREGSFGVFLLHGITGSGKTEVYLQMIAWLRERGGGAIVLVPEIALTPQLADRFRGRFGDEVAVLHSGLTPRQRLDAWQHIRLGRCPIVIGARSAVFAPVPNLRAIVVDEEHDGSFKQEDGVRYHARSVALVRAKRLGAVVVLGSATPALESYHNARQGRYEWLRLSSRPTPRPLPRVEVVSLKIHRPDPQSLLTARLKNAVAEVAAAGEQAILFLNRRGFTTTMLCESCGSLQSCPDCSAPSMTYHLDRNRLMCHLCGHIEAAPDTCRVCGSAELVHGGAGTERVELALARDLAGVRILRLDRDTSRGKRLLDTLARFRRREADVLVGTQMLSKGHDFPGVTLVGILQADHGLGLPDPRAAERTFQLLTQVSGRAGRGDRPGRVLVQAYAIEHPAIRFAASHDFVGFAARELADREQLLNPPFGHLTLVRVLGNDSHEVELRARAVADRVRALAAHVAGQHADEPAPVMVLGPVPSPIVKINRRTRWQLLLRAHARGPLRWLLGQLRAHLGAAGSGSRQTLAIVDVDPQSLL